MAAAPARPQQLTSPDQVPEGLAKSDWSSIRAAYEAGRHAFQPTANGWQARNPGQQWTTTFDRRGFVAAPKAGGWTWGLELQGYGFGAHQQTIAGIPAVQAEGSRLTYQWDSAVQEWFINDQRGLEHGFTVSTRPAADPAALTAPGIPPPSLSFLLAVRGGLRPHVTPDALGVEFRDAAGATVLNYAGLKVWDAEGKILTSHFELADSSPTAPGTPPAVRLLVEERGARYPITIDPIAQQAYLKASNTGAGDQFGYSVAISGDTVVVGAWNEDSNATGVNGTQSDNSASAAGAAYVFVRSAGTWTQQAYLKASNTGAGDNFGYSVAISGDTVVVGAQNEASNATGVNGTQSDNSASSSGAAYVFVRSSGLWTQQAYLKASNTGAGDNFGYSVAISGDTVVAGAYFEGSNATGVNGSQSDNSATRAGAAYVFVRSSGTWSQQAYLKASNTEANDFFGRSVSISGDTVVVGANRESSNATGVNGTESNNSAASSGAAYVFVRSSGTWSQQAYLKASNAEAYDQFGWSVAISGDTVVVGALGEAGDATGGQSNNSASYAGAAHVFVRSSGTWTQQAYLKASNAEANDYFSYSVAISGDTVVAGAYQEASNATGVNGSQSDNSTFLAGAAYVFVRSSGTWTQQAYLKASNTAEFDYFGQSVAISGDTVVVGATEEASNATGVNGSQSDNSAGGSGAAYVFTGLGVATVTTPTSVSSAATSATLGGNVTSAGGATITARGIVCSQTATNNSPQIGGTGVTNVVGSGTTGVFTVTASGLTAATPYTYAAYVTTSAGTTYSSTGTFTTLNTAPTLAAIAVSGTEDTTLTFTAANFTGAYTHVDGTALASITVATLPATGLLKLSGTNVTASQVIPAANLANLTYVPAANENGAKTFTVTASDGTASSAAATVTMTLAEVNDAPSFALPVGTVGFDAATWTARESGSLNWRAIASSADGTKLAAVVNGGQIYTSTDSGATWTARESGSRGWRSIASSTDGTKLAAVAYGGQIYTSTDSGATWTAQESNRGWYAIASSADGTKLAAVVWNGQTYTSTDSGATWVAGASNWTWLSIASSADGTKLAAVAYGGQIYTSTDTGATWTARESSRTWLSIASSADGTKLAATAQNGSIYTSTYPSANWTARMNDANRNWRSIASSADGTKLAAVVDGGQIYTSTDSGATWTARESDRSWYGIASSADGTKLAATVNGGQIYTPYYSIADWAAGGSDRSWQGIASSADGTKLAAVVNGGQIYTSEDRYNVFVAANAGAQSQSNFATSLSGGPTDESAQTVSLTVTNNNNALFSAQPAINASGTLTFTPALNAVGEATVTVTAQDSGGTANGGVATSTRTFTIWVEETAPGTPTGVSATGSNSSATVSFTAPTNTGGAAINGYTVTSSPQGITATGTSSPITVTGLTNGTAYTFTVTATNELGTGAASSASSAVTPAPTVTAPGAPTGISASVSNSSAIVSFTAPASTGGSAITGYTVTSSPQGITATGTSSPITVAGLTNGTPYTFTITATNAVGTGTASSASSPVTPANTAPVNTVPGAQTVNEDTALTFTGSQAISVSDVDGNVATTRLTVAQGTLTASLAGGATISAGVNGTATLTLAGTPTQINAALLTLSYQGALNFNGADTLTVLSTDALAATASSTVTLTVTAVNDAPTLTTVSTLTGATEATAFAISYATLLAAANAADGDGDTLGFRVEAVSTGTLTTSGVSVVAGTTLLGANDSLVWTPAANANGTLNAFTIKAWDGTTTSATAIQVQGRSPRRTTRRRSRTSLIRALQRTAPPAHLHLRLAT